jgi:nucleoside-diphosphate-sugar epimerase
MSMRSQHVLVTGGAGYLGSTLVPQLLGAGCRVRVIDSLRYGGQSLLGVWSHPAFDFVRGDVGDRKLVGESLDGIDAVVHLAAIVGDPACAREPEVARAVNLEASRQLIALSRAGGVSRFVFASTCSNYGRMSAPDEFVDESSPLQPLSLYAETKVAVERLLLEGGGDGMCVTPLRFATIFGVSPRMRFDLTVNEFTRTIITSGHLVVFGEQFWRPYVHVADAATAIRLVLEAPRSTVDGQVFNVGSSAQNFRKQQIVDFVHQQAPEATIDYVRVASDPRDYRVSFAKIRKVLCFEPTRSVPSGVAEVARLVRQGVLADAVAGACHN